MLFHLLSTFKLKVRLRKSTKKDSFSQKQIHFYQLATATTRSISLPTTSLAVVISIL